jgi:hypothetical protein
MEQVRAPAAASAADRLCDHARRGPVSACGVPEACPACELQRRATGQLQAMMIVHVLPIGHVADTHTAPEAVVVSWRISC